jgi:OOP family OmpA-OmpF porin
MNKLSKLAFIAATAVVAASAMAQSVPASRQATNDNWVNGTGERTLLARCILDAGNR